MFETILVLAPHTDDGEFGCGGSIFRFIEEKKNIFHVALSRAEESVPEGFPKDILEKEVREATRVLGIPPSNLIVERYPVRKFADHRQEILDLFIRLKGDLNPDLVFLPCSYDLHQDHHTVSVEGLRAFKSCTILGYEIPWNNITFNTRSFIHLDERHVERKVEALSCYRSQLSRHYASENFIRSLAHTRGVQIGVEFAETFDVLRWVIK